MIFLFYQINEDVVSIRDYVPKLYKSHRPQTIEQYCIYKQKIHLTILILRKLSVVALKVSGHISRKVYKMIKQIICLLNFGKPYS